MKISHKIIFANVFNVLLIILTGIFSYHLLDLVLTKLRFTEIADDLNKSFLEMRLSEKNYFLYGDGAALPDILQKLSESKSLIEETKDDIVKATGEENFQQLNESLEAYREAIESAQSGGEAGEALDESQPQEAENAKAKAVEASVREAGQKLREFSSRITRLERTNVNDIISGSRTGLLTSLVVILIPAIAVGQLIARRMLGSFKEIEKAAHSISEGNFSKVELKVSSDELGSVIKAINSMSEELSNREEIIIQSKKLASIGILTAGVAHELGNPLNNISMLAQGYRELYDSLSREERLNFMVEVEEETERIKEIVKNLLDFSKPKEAHLIKMGINAVIEKSLKLVQNMICICNIEVHLCLSDGLPLVMLDVHQIQEVFINLLTNAIQAGSPGDAITVTSRPGEDGGGVEVEIRDNGRGIPAEHLPHVFDPFFTTRGTNGTGLGLFVSYGIIKNHHGSIDVTSEVGKGACFTMRFPACTEGDRN